MLLNIHSINSKIDYKVYLFENISQLRALYNQTKDFEKANQLNNSLYQIF